MPIWGKVELFCCVCGVKFECSVGSTVKGYFQQACCTRECLQEKDWRYTLSVLGKAYYPDPRTKEEKEQ